MGFSLGSSDIEAAGALDHLEYRTGVGEIVPVAVRIIS
jgi:hypothetical protein